MVSGRFARSICSTVSLVLLAAAQEIPENWARLPKAEGLYRGQPVRFRVLDGMALVEGDIILGPVEELAGPPGKLGRLASVRDGERFRWPAGIIPYEIDPALPNPTRVLDAIAEWEAKTKIRFKLREGESNYVRIARTASGCSATVGMIGGRQIVNLADNCSTGNTIHELGHSIGLWHTQSRRDRNRYVRVLYENIDKPNWDQYDQHLIDGVDIGPYDYASIMHYSISGFTRNFRFSLETIPPGIPIGQRSGISEGDRLAIARMYGAAPEQVVVTTHPEGLPVIVDGVRYLGPQTFSWSPGESHVIAAEELLPESNENTRLEFARWSDNKPREHTITVSPQEKLYVAQYARYHRVRTGVTPEGAGVVRIVPVSADGFYPVGTRLLLTAEPTSDLRFAGWRAGPGGSTFLSANGQGNGSNPIELNLQSAGAYYVAVFSAEPMTTITSEPPGALITVDGSAGYTPRIFLWPPGSQHRISIADRITLNAGTRRLEFLSWAHGGEKDQTVVASSSSTTLVVKLREQFQLLTEVFSTRTAGAPAPTSSRNIRILNATEDGFYEAGSRVDLEAAGLEEVPFSNWYGDLSGTATREQLVVSEQTLVGANFLSPGFFNLFSIVHHASRLPAALTPGGLAVLYAPGVGPQGEITISPDGAGHYPKQVSGVSVLIEDTPAEILRLEPHAVTFLTPSLPIERGFWNVTLRSPLRSYTRAVGVLEASPGIYTRSANGRGTPLGDFEGPVERGATLRLLATGLPPDASAIQVEIGGRLAAVVDVLRGEIPGQVWIRAQVPLETPSGPEIPVFVISHGVRSQLQVTIPVR